MPYNPSSAYPRHSTYTPPVFNRGFARGFNEFDWSQRFGHANQMPDVDVSHALRAGMRRPTQEGIVNALTAQGRQGLGTALLNAMVNKPAGMRKTIEGRMIWNRAEQGDDPTEVAPAQEQGPREIDMRTPEGRAEAKALFPGPAEAASSNPALWIPTPRGGGPARERTPTFPPSETGGRPHVGGVNDRLNAINQRVTTTSAMNKTVENVLSGKAGGPMTVPKLIFGAARSRLRRGA